MPSIPLIKRHDLIEPVLSFQIIGICFRVFNELGPGLQERYYQKAVSHSLKETNIAFQEQVPLPIHFAKFFTGRYFADIILENKIVIELKKGNHINRKHALQLLAYLKTANIPLGILVYFGSDGVFFKRLINFTQHS